MVEDHLELHLGRDLRPDAVGPAEDVFQVLLAKHLQLHADELGPCVQLEVVADHHAKKAGAGPARRPEDVGVFAGAGMHQRAVGQHHIDAQQVFTAQPHHATVPAKAAL